MFAEFLNMQGRVHVIGEVRGSHGLSAVMELVKDRVTRQPISMWREMHPALRRVVAVVATRKCRSAYVEIASYWRPFMNDENDLADALALMEQLLTDMDWS